MKRIIALVLVMLMVAPVCYADGSMAYMYYADATKEIEGVYVNFIGDFNTRFDNGEKLSNIEVCLYYEYAKVILSLRTVFMVQSGATTSDEVPSYYKTTVMTNDLVADMLDTTYQKYSDGEITQDEFFDEVRPTLDILIETTKKSN